MAVRLGIDEAGRGCVLGPMVFGAVAVHDRDEPALRAMGVRDSKMLRPARREELRGRIERLAVAWRVLPVGPAELDAESLGEIGKRAFVTLAAELRPDVLVLDAPVPPGQIPRFAADIAARLVALGLHGIEIVAENKADVNHPCCSAASVIAKTTRDAALADIARQAGTDIGSGYPSDRRTRDYLAAVWRKDGAWPSWVRTKWDTARRVVASSSQPLLF